MAIFLTERRDCSFFKQLKEGNLPLSKNNYTIEQCLEDNVILVRDVQGNSLYVFAGRQIITSERLEVLSLAADLGLPDGQNIDDVIKNVLLDGGIPVLPWSPGKWFGGRGRIVEKVLHSFSPSQLLIGDTSLRPLGWPEPSLVKYAMSHGFKVIAGSDPLPFAGEERVVGKYGIVCEMDFDTNKPLSAIRRLFFSPSVQISRTGLRCDPFTVFYRLLLNSRVRRR
ncbi:MAG: hypothetical protein PHR77_19030 [Kiritimatiellae bacterium]|nr:hypothetical protein [Kiritimatiellia bacterium]MDD5522646.1 hypothetical protein [Kiritimatiellia bacterium]